MAIDSKEKRANASLYSHSRTGGGCQNVTFENHPYACDGSGWFSLCLKRLSERHTR